jgi:hypothetical protein
MFGSPPSTYFAVYTSFRNRNTVEPMHIKNFALQQETIKYYKDK